ncbi:MAG: flagellin lysine-N-methylase [Clostridiales bacterium]|nr:flagellin lysine-N-methylase [Clostridiales bacterium]
MTVTMPGYYEQFRCLASACRDNCCRTGWEIVVDEGTVDYYRSLPEPQRSRILSALGRDGEEEAYIRPENGQCPFLTEQGLCGLVLELGEEHIGEICALHPRYREWFPDRMEIGVGLCCEEAARLILSDPEPCEFVSYLTDAEEDEEPLPLYPPLLALRDRLFETVQDRARPLALRWAEALRLTRTAQRAMNENRIPDPACEPDTLAAVPTPWQTVLAALLDAHLEMEVLEPTWGRTLAELRENLETLDWPGFFAALGERGYEYEHLTVYLIFRYFLKASFDGDALGRLEQTVGMVLTVAALGAWQWQQMGRFSLADQIEVARQYSKEVEYSDDNMETLAEAFLFEEPLSLPHLLGLLEG